MPKKNQRQDARRDANEPDIVKHLQDCGHKVERISDPADLLVFNFQSGRWSVLEVKIPGGRYTPKQIKYREENPNVDIPVVRTKEDAEREVAMR